MTDNYVYKPEMTKYGLMEKFRVGVEFHLTSIISHFRAWPWWLIWWPKMEKSRFLTPWSSNQELLIRCNTLFFFPEKKWFSSIFSMFFPYCYHICHNVLYYFNYFDYYLGHEPWIRSRSHPSRICLCYHCAILAEGWLTCIYILSFFSTLELTTNTWVRILPSPLPLPNPSKHHMATPMCHTHLTLN